jgi:Glycosyl transferases group 1
VQSWRAHIFYNRKPLRDNLVYRVINPARFLVDWVQVQRPVVGRGTRGRVTKVLLVSDASETTSEEQFNPFSFCRTELRDRHKIISTHILISDLLRAVVLLTAPFDVIILKLSFRRTAKDALNVVRELAAVLNGRRLIYFDGDDDLCVQWPEIISHVDLYVKKQLFSDRSQYLKQFIGKSNLTDYVHRRHNISFDEDPVAHSTQPVTREQLSKLVLGCNLASDRTIVKLHQSCALNPQTSTREYDIVFRGSVPTDWMRYLRREIGPALARLEKRYRVIAPMNRVPVQEYYREMQRSRICISPFGYGEVCWRDFEAILCGCLLMKPDVGHVETYPNIFRPNQTYVPIQWDFSDLEEKCCYYLENENERQRIAGQAFEVLDRFYKEDGIKNVVVDLIESIRRTDMPTDT